jgi:hypothetical protein
MSRHACAFLRSAQWNMCLQYYHAKKFHTAMAPAALLARDAHLSRYRPQPFGGSIKKSVEPASNLLSDY